MSEPEDTEPEEASTEPEEADTGPEEASTEPEEASTEPEEASTGQAKRQLRDARRRERHETAVSERAYRVLVACLVLAVLAVVLVTGATVKPAIIVTSYPTAGPLGYLPAVSRTLGASAAWNCPGPLPAGNALHHSQIVVLNDGGVTAHVDIRVVGDAISALGGTAVAGWSQSLTVASEGSAIVPLHTTGFPQNDAVSLISNTSAVSVFEEILPITPKKAGALTAAPLESPCDLGTSHASYFANGSTATKSDVVVAVYNPTASQAVVGLRVATGLLSTTPPALQALTIKPYSLQTFNLQKWVVQHPVVAVTVSATVGQIAVGGFDTQLTQASAGQSLLIGVNQTAPTWTLTPGLGLLGRTVAVRLYDPTSAPATVTILSPVSGAPTVELTESVPAGGVVTVPLQVVAAAGKAKSSTPIVEGPIVISTARGVGLVVGRIDAAPLTPSLSAVNYFETTTVPAKQWIIGGESAAEGLIVVNPGKTAVSVKVYGFVAAGGALRGIGTIAVPAQGRKTLVVTNSGYAGYMLSSPVDVVAEGALYGRHGLTLVPAAASPVSGVPVVG